MNNPLDPAAYLSKLSPEKRRLLIRKLSSRKAGAESGAISQDRIRVHPGPAPIPLSFAQERLWFLDQLEGPNAAYNIPMAWQMSGLLNVEALRRSIRRIVQRHEALRTRVAVESGNPVQVFPSHIDFAVPLTDLSTLPESERRAELTRRIEEEDLKPFDLSADPLVRAEVLALGCQEHVLLLTFHHMVFDGWSLGVLSRELSAAYTALRSGGDPALPELPVQYADYTLWQRERFQGDRLDHRMNFWRKQLSGAPALLDLPLDRPHPPRRSYRGKRLPFTISKEWTGRLKESARDAGVTLFMALLAVYGLLLSRYTSMRDLVIGTSVAGRDRPELEPLIGCFVNTLVLRIRLSGNDCFREFLRHVKKVVLEARTHGDIPFEKLVEGLSPERNLSHTPLFQAAFVLQNMPMAQPSLPELAISPLETDRLTAKFDLNLIMEETGAGLSASLEYNTDIFEAETISRMVRHFQNLLKAAVSNPEQPVAALSMLSEGEKEALRRFNRTEAACPENKTVVDLFEEQAAKTPEETALIFDGVKMTYQELIRRVDHLGRTLKEVYGVKPGEPVGVMMDRSEALIVAVFSILKAGAVYVPILPDTPASRREYMLRDSGCRILLTGAGSIPHLEGIDVCPVDANGPIRNPSDRTDFRSLASATGPAYIIYTSGSTGQPKGVVIEHRPLVNRLLWMQRQYPLSRSDVILQKTPISFDVSIWELFWGSICGAAVSLLAPGGEKNPEEIVRAVERDRVTCMHFVPSMLNAFLEWVETGKEEIPRMASLKRVFASGEALGVSQVRLFNELFFSANRTTLHNLYGPTEATVDVSGYDCSPLPPAEAVIPIGKPIQNIRLHVLDANLMPLPVGVPGEICIAGLGLARGYLNPPDLTAEKFLEVTIDGVPERIYRTGDRARRRTDGNLEYLGRMDHQIKLRGFRIELGEIESVLCRYPGVRQAAVTVYEDPPGNRQLAAYLVSGGDSGIEEIRGFLEERLPDYMIPAFFRVLDRMPLTVSGKIDRKKLPQPESEIPAGEFAAPQNRTEEILAGIWSGLLKRERVGRHDDFFRLGGHSLLAVQVISRVREAFRVSPPVRKLFEVPTIAGLAAYIEQIAKIEQARKIRERVIPGPGGINESDGAAPLSFSQERLWFLDRLTPGNIAYNVPGALRLTGVPDTAALERSLQEITRRHQVLRTCFPSKENGPVPEILSPWPPCSPLVRILDLQSLAGEEKAGRAEALVQEEAATPFDLSCGPLIRVALLRLEPDDHILLVTMHHIVSDGWSMGVLVRELSALYTAYRRDNPSPLPEPLLQYSDFARWQRQTFGSDAAERDLAFWKEQLKGAPSHLDLPFDRPRPALQSFRGALAHFRVEPELTQDLVRIGRESGGTLFMTLFGAFALLLFRYSRQEDLVIGTPVANREPVETESLIGFFVNTLALRMDFSGNPDVAEFLSRVRRTAISAFSHQALPFERLVEALQPERNLSHNPIFQVMFVLQNAPMDPLELPGLRVEPMEVSLRAAKMDLTLSMLETEQGLKGLLEYNTDLFFPDTVQRMIGHFRTLLQAIVKTPREKISRLPLLTEKERQRILFQWGKGSSASSDCFAASWVCDRIDEWAVKTPVAPALEFGEKKIPYRELKARTDRLAGRLQALGVGPEERVAILMERSPERVVAILAVLKAGGAYVPLDPEYPGKRLAFMIEDAFPRVLITRRHLEDRLPQHFAQVLLMDGEEQAPADETPIERKADKENLAYIIYTSGTTGTPKGVMVSYRGLGNLAQALIRLYYVEKESRMLQFASFSFDASVSEVAAALCAGATLVIAEAKDMLPGEDLSRLLEEKAVTHVTLPPSALAVMPDGRWPQGKTLIVAGEACPIALAGKWAAGRRLVNGYGPTEATVCATTCEYVPGEEKLPVGRPIDAARVYIVDDNLQPVPAGVSGELLIGGIGLARGYRSRPELTAERFIPDPFGTDPGSRLYRTGDLARFLSDGRIEYLGRLDHQVKIRGYRVEPGEIEAVLNRHPSIKTCAAVARKTRENDLRLCAYIVSRFPATIDELRGHLRESLPGYMVPSDFVLLDSLPLTPNGKIDRNALPDPAETGSGDAGERSTLEGGSAPRNPGEEMLAEIWAEVLALSRAGIHDNFFDLGGHSLLATRIVSRIGQAFGVDLPVRALFEYPTIAGLGRRLQDLGPEKQPAAPPIVPVPREGHHPLSFAQERLWFLDKLVPDNSFYNIPTALVLKGRLDIEALSLAFTEITRRHESLRTVFSFSGGRPVQVISCASTVPMAEIDLRHLVAGEREREVRRLAEEEARKPFDLTRGPLMRVTRVHLGGNPPESPPASESERVPVSGHVLLITLHHIVADGWSMGVLVRELEALYTAFYRKKPSPLPELAIQYVDFSLWQRRWLAGKVLDTHLAFWKEQLAGAPFVLELPQSRPRPPVPTFRGAEERFSLNPEALDKVKALCRRTGASLFMTLLSAFSLLLHRYSGQQDFLVGTPIANRNRGEIEPLIGFFVNTLALRCDLAGQPTVCDLISRVKKTALNAYAHQDLPFEKLVDALSLERDMSRNPLVQVTFALQNAPMPAGTLPDLEVASLELPTGQVRFDLELHAREDGKGLHGWFNYSLDLFESAFIGQMAGHFTRLVAWMADHPDRRITEALLLEQEERRRILYDWNRTRADYPRSRCIQELFHEQVERTPEARAVEFGEQFLTYRELEGRADRLAHALCSRGLGPDRPAGICMERSLEMVVSILAVLKAGGAYVPLDPAYPDERLRHMVENSRIRVLLTQAHLKKKLSGIGAGSQAEILCVDALETENPPGDRGLPATGADPANIAYVIYTSGSTGTPKGVMISHRALCNHMAWMKAVFPLEAGDRVLQKTPFSFDASVWEFYAPLLSGACLVLAPPGVLQDLDALFDTLVRHRITILQLVPSLLRVMLEHPGVSALKGLKRVFCGGEALPPDLQESFFRRLDCPLINLYGPTEACIDSTSHVCLPGRPPSVGRPVHNLCAHILDERMEPVPPGVSGELYLAGEGLARGYLHAPSITAERFLPDPFSKEGERLYRTGDLARYDLDGNIEFLGRPDRQLKIRGFRMEAGEIEAVLEKTPGVRRAVVTAREDLPGEVRLVAYVVPDPEALAGEEAQEAEKEQVSKWREVFQRSYDPTVSPAADPIADSASDPASIPAADAAFNTVGWISSFTGEPIPAEEMREWVDQTVFRILSCRPRGISQRVGQRTVQRVGKVLEIGCGSGLLLSRIAPQSDLYWATDFSEAALDSAAQAVRQCGLQNAVRLLHRAADDFSGFPDASFDLVILNSVIQYFPDQDYLFKVLEGAFQVLSPGGVVFVGDVRNLHLAEAFHTALQCHRASPSLTAAQLKQRIRQSLLQEEELLVSPLFFKALEKRLPAVCQVEMALKRGAFQNEMTRYRYDVFLHAAPAAESPVADRTETAVADFREEDPEDLAAWLSARGEDRILLINVPDARLGAEMERMRLLSSLSDSEPAGPLLERPVAPTRKGIDPESLFIGIPGWQSDLFPSESDRDGVFHVLFRREKELSPPDARRNLPGLPLPWSSPDRIPWRSLTSRPLENRLSRKLVPRLRESLANKLPEYMTPSAFVLLEKLPMTPSGKVDHRALPAPEKPRTGTEEGTRAQTQEEKALAAIWKEVLGIEGAGIHDNFFELGGDSILSIQIVSRASQQGMALKARDLYQHQTIAELARVAADLKQTAAGNAAPCTGPAPLTPIQEELFRQDPVNPHHFNQSVLLQVSPELSPPMLRKALETLFAHHESLRIRFSRTGGSWQQEVDSTNASLSFMEMDLSGLAPEKQGAELTACCSDLQKQLDFIHGPLIRCAFFHLGKGKPGRLFLTIHHLVVDGVSWRILLEDLQTACRQAMGGEPVTLPAATTPCRQWARRLHGYARSEPLQKKAEFWLDLAGRPEPPLPRDPIPGGGENTRGSADHIRVSLDPEETSALLREIPPVYNTGMNDVLLSALWQSLARWTGRDSIRIHLEGHGREDLFSDLDLSRTVGWFTTVFPVSLSCRVEPEKLLAPEAQGDVLRAVKEQLRRISGQGIEYGLLVHLAKHPSLQAVPQPEVCFNYLGQLDAGMGESSLFKPASEPVGSFQEERALRTYLFEINASVVGGKLLVDWTYSRNRHRHETVAALAETFIGALKAVITHCRSPEAGGYTPSDFPEAGLSQEDLDELIEDLGEIDE